MAEIVRTLLVIVALSMSVSGYRLFVGQKCGRVSSLRAHSQDDAQSDKTRIVNSCSDMFGKTGALTSSLLLGNLLTQLQPAMAAGNQGKITVIGSNGKTGKLIVNKLATAGVPVQPTYARTPPSLKVEGTLLEPAVCDVTSVSTIESAIKDSSAVIFAASASKKGGNAQAVDYIGVKNIANECVRLKIPKLVVISSGAVTRPDSLGFKITNLFGNIMNYKLDGENAVRDVYANSGLSYAIIRPGGLVGQEVDSGKGVAAVELNQGDTIAGEINRADVAECAIACAQSKTIPERVTFEMYNIASRAALEGKFAENSGYEQRSSLSYEEMFKGLTNDFNKI
jgi:nucleoside-diphosphate-sugar epimerase